MSRAFALPPTVSTMRHPDLGLAGVHSVGEWLTALQHHRASEFYDRTIDQFEQMHADTENSARIMAISVHPYIMGAPHRTRHFRRIFERIREKRDVLFWTGSQILDWYLQAGPKAPP
jgi:hypothetical protein